MRPFLGIDITENKKNEQTDGGQFVVATVSEVQSRALDTESNNIAKMIKGPIILRAAGIICICIAIFIAGSMLEVIFGEEGIGFAQAYKNAGWLFWLMGAVLIAGIFMTLFSGKKAESNLDSDEGTCALNRLETISGNIRTELKIPSDAADMDVLSFTYKLKNGEPEPKAKAMEETAYSNCDMWVFADEEMLYIADMEKKYAIALSCMQRIRTVNKKIIIPFWNKDTPHNKGEYKAYKIKEDSNGNYYFRPYHILEFSCNGERWGIFFPCYELPIFEKLTGLTAEAAE